MIKLSHYRKGIGCFVGTGILWAGPYVSAGKVDRFGWYALAVKLAVDLGVVGLSNEPKPAPLELPATPWTGDLPAKVAAAEVAPAVVAPIVVEPVVAPVAPVA